MPAACVGGQPGHTSLLSLRLAAARRVQEQRLPLPSTHLDRLDRDRQLGGLAGLVDGGRELDKVLAVGSQLQWPGARGCKGERSRRRGGVDGGGRRCSDAGFLSSRMIPSCAASIKPGATRLRPQSHQARAPAAPAASLAPWGTWRQLCELHDNAAECGAGRARRGSAAATAPLAPLCTGEPVAFVSSHRAGSPL